MNAKTDSGIVGIRTEATRILKKRNQLLEMEIKDLHRSCGRQVFDCLADKARVLISGQKMSGLICPEMEQKILNGVEDRYPYDLSIEGTSIRSYFSPGRNLNPQDIPLYDALKAWCDLYRIEFTYDSDGDTYHFTKCEFRFFE